jgi:CRP-like cAMP-binding protein
MTKTSSSAASKSKRNFSVTEYMELPLFENISKDDLNTLLFCLGAYERAFKKGEIIILEQQKIQYVGIVLSGTVHMLKEDIWGHQALLAYMTKGELCGETFAVQKESTSHVTFVAASNANLLFLPAGNIIHTCPRQCSFHAQLTENLFHLLGQKSLSFLEKIEISSKPSLREKLLAYLSMLSQRQKSKYITVPLSRSELADYLDANRSSMTRELSSMKKEGLIDFDKSTFIIKQ